MENGIDSAAVLAACSSFCYLGKGDDSVDALLAHHGMVESGLNFSTTKASVEKGTLQLEKAIVQSECMVFGLVSISPLHPKPSGHNVRPA